MSQGQDLYYLTLEDVLLVYAEVVGTDRQGAEDVLRDRGALEGALNRPRNYAVYRDADVALQAAVLAPGSPRGSHSGMETSGARSSASSPSWPPTATGWVGVSRNEPSGSWMWPIYT